MKAGYVLSIAPFGRTLKEPSTRNWRIRLLFLLGLMLGIVTPAILPPAAQAAPRALPQPRQRTGARRAPFQFEANQGQMSMDGDFLARGPDYGVALAATTATMTLWKHATPPEAARQSADGSTPRAGKLRRLPRFRSQPGQRQAQPEASTLRLHLEGADPRSHGVGVEQLPGRVNYARATGQQLSFTNIPTFAQVRYTSIYPGIDVVYYGNDRLQLEYDFVVAPGADPNAIALRFEGADALELDRQGSLVLQTAMGELRQPRPTIYQEGSGARQPVAGDFVLRDGNLVGFQVGSYDVTRPLIIDPVLVYSTYLGGSGYPYSGDKDVGYDIAADAAGNAYVTGATNSNGQWHADAYVIKFDPTGSRVLYTTYLDGNGWDDAGAGIAVDAAGNAYVAGALENLGTFVAKLSTTGAPLYFKYFGGDPGYSLDYGADIAVDGSGNAYVTGGHYDLLGPFPATPGAFQTISQGDTDAFVAKLNPQGAFVYATLLGGNDTDDGFGIAVDSGGNAYVTGGTDSHPSSAYCPGCIPFPTTSGAFQRLSGGDRDVFITKVNPTGSALAYSTYLGGSGAEEANAIALDATGNAYVAGLTMAIGTNNFPTVNAFKSTYSGGLTDSFYAKLNAAGSALVYSSYLSGHLGAQAGDGAYGIAVDTAGNAYVTGDTTSVPDGAIWTGSPGFPVVSALQPDLAGSSDAFLAKVAPSGKTLVYSTYVGGMYSDSGYGIALDRQGAVYLTGLTMSEDFPTTSGAYQPAYGGGNCDIWSCADTFVMKLAASAPMPVDDRSHDVRYDGWSGGVNLSALGQGYRAASAAGQSLSYFTAVATSVSLITYYGPDQGMAQVFIDGVDKGTLDLYWPGSEYRAVQEYSGLSSARHTILVKVLGQKSVLSSGTQVRVDGFKVGTATIDDNHPAVRYGSWPGTTNTSALGRGYHYAAAAGHYALFKVAGTQFTWITARGPAYGQAQVIVDGVAVGTLDLYSSTQQWQARQVVGGLVNKAHTVQIKVLGTRNPASTGNTIVFDGFSVP